MLYLTPSQYALGVFVVFAKITPIFIVLCCVSQALEHHILSVYRFFSLHYSLASVICFISLFPDKSISFPIFSFSFYYLSTLFCPSYYSITWLNSTFLKIGSFLQILPYTLLPSYTQLLSCVGTHPLEHCTKYLNLKCSEQGLTDLFCTLSPNTLLPLCLFNATYMTRCYSVTCLIK